MSRPRPPLPAIVLVAAALFLGAGYWLATRNDRTIQSLESAGSEGWDAAAAEAPPAVDTTSPAAGEPRTKHSVWSEDLRADGGLGSADLHAMARAGGVTRAVGAHGTILERDAAGTWTREKSGTDVDLAGVAMQGSAALVVGARGTALRFGSPDGGQDAAWTTTKTGTTADLASVAFAGPADADALAVGAHGTVLHLAKGASAWTAETSPVPADLTGVWSSADGGLVLAVGRGGAILRRTPAGWVLEPSGTTEDLFAIAGEGKSVRAVGAHGTVLQRSGGGESDAGASWSLASPPAAEGPASLADLYGVAVHGGTFHVVGAHGSTLRFGSTGWAIDRSGTDRDLFCVIAEPALIAAAGAGGIVMKRAQ